MDPSSFPDREKEDPYHFVAYVPVNGVLYELDGLRKSPLMHAAVEGDEWMDQARETIEQRIATYPPGSVSGSVLPASHRTSVQETFGGRICRRPERTSGGPPDAGDKGFAMAPMFS